MFKFEHSGYVWFQYLLIFIPNKIIMHYSFRSTPTWTMRGRPQSAFASTPGPAHYTPQKSLLRSASVSAVTQQRNLFGPSPRVPGPGAYESKSYITQGPKRTMSARSTEYLKRTPGPQDYENTLLKTKNASPNYTMSTMSKSYHQMTADKNSYKPAPTSYNNLGSSKKSGVVIGNVPRMGLEQEEKTPAPNYYKSKEAKDYTSRSQPRASIGTEARASIPLNCESSPGPQAYNKKSIFDQNRDKKRGYSCRNKTIDQIALEQSKYPGPGQYNLTLYDKPKAPRCASANNLRRTFVDEASKDRNGPGPGQHSNFGFNLSKNKSAASYQFGNSNRRPLSDYETTPAPNYYRNDKQQVMHSAPKFSVTKGTKNETLLATPGPADYDPNVGFVKENSKLYQIGKQDRPNFEKHRFSPGPGYYNLAGKLERGWTFKKELRIAFTDLKSDAKNANQYDIPSKVVDPPSYMRVQPKVQFNTPSKSPYSTMNSASRSPMKSTKNL